jgi:hypothetical protein
VDRWFNQGLAVSRSGFYRYVHDFSKRPKDHDHQYQYFLSHVFVVWESEEAADVFTGQRKVWKQIRPTDPAGILSISRFYVTPSGNAYSYSAGRVLSALYVYSQK